MSLYVQHLCHYLMTFDCDNILENLFGNPLAEQSKTSKIKQNRCEEAQTYHKLTGSFSWSLIQVK